MSAPPYMRLYWGDYHKATRHLSRDQHGAYMLLIGEAWRLGGALPDDDALLAAWSLCTADEWAAMKSTIMSFFSLRRGKWTHDRVREELSHYETISRKRKSAGKRGGSVTRGKTEDNSEAIAPHLPTKPEPEPEPEREDTHIPCVADLATQNREAQIAAGDALASMAVCPGIANLAPLRSLLTVDPPCDWRDDVLPAIESAAAWHRSRDGPGSMSSWTTARKIALQNRDRRLAPAPVEPRHERLSSSAKFDTKQANLARAFANS